MSALADGGPGAGDGATASRERSEWRGEDVSSGEVAERLMALNREHARHEHGHAATRTLNLLVAPGDDVEPDALAAQLGGLADRHPSRTIVVREQAAARLDAYIAIDCTIGSGAGCAGHCHDMAQLVADAERLAHADSLVRPLRVAGLPSVLWLPGVHASRAQDPLAHDRRRDRARRRRGERRRRCRPRSRAPQRSTSRACATSRGCGCGAGGATWPRASTIPRRCGCWSASIASSCARAHPQQASALLLAAWIAARAGWTIERLTPEQTGWSGSARRADGGAIAIVLGPPETPDLTGIHALALHAGDETIALRAPVAAPNPARAFAAALGMFDTATPGYAPALAALLDGMEAR